MLEGKLESANKAFTLNYIVVKNLVGIRNFSKQNYRKEYKKVRLESDLPAGNWEFIRRDSDYDVYSKDVITKEDKRLYYEGVLDVSHQLFKKLLDEHLKLEDDAVNKEFNKLIGDAKKFLNNLKNKQLKQYVATPPELNVDVEVENRLNVFKKDIANTLGVKEDSITVFISSDNEVFYMTDVYPNILNMTLVPWATREED